MVLMIDIQKEARNHYVARACVGGVEVTDVVAYERIAAAIAGQASAIPEGFAHFVEFTYSGMSTGTQLPSEAVACAEELANRLVQLQATAHELNRHLSGSATPAA